MLQRLRKVIPKKGTLNKVDKKYEKGNDLKCYCCDGKQLTRNCRFKDAKSYACSLLGHLSRLFQAKENENQLPKSDNGKKGGNPQSTHLLIGEENALKGEHLYPREYSMFTLGSIDSSPYRVLMNIAGKLLEVEVDTGASLSVISEKTYENLVSGGRALPLETSGVVL